MSQALDNVVAIAHDVAFRRVQAWREDGKMHGSVDDARLLQKLLLLFAAEAADTFGAGFDARSPISRGTMEHFAKALRERAAEIPVEGENLDWRVGKSPASPAAPQAEPPARQWRQGSPPEDPDLLIEVQTTEIYRFRHYKPDGARQMGKPGRWQKLNPYGGFDNAELVAGPWR
ncbi:MAG: hypothetical protein RJA36_1397, partial [Pseudomonadota bacterium]